MDIPLAKAKVSVVAELDGLEKGLKSAKTKITAVTSTVKKSTDRMNKGWDKVGRHINKATSHLQGFRTQLIGLGAAYAAERIASDFLAVAESFEAMGTQLDVLTKGRGIEVLDELNKWALEMPVNTEKVVDSFRLMTAMGLIPTMSTLETLTDVASIFGDDVLQRLALQLGQASAKGKIMAQDLNIMAEAGINARKYIQDAFGMTLEEVQNSNIDITRILEAIFSGMEKEFGGSAKKMMGTWRGLKTVTKSYFVEIERSIMAAGVFDELKTQLSGFNTIMKDWIEVNKDVINQKVPEYVDDFKKSAQDLWDVINYDPDILKYGLLGLALGGKKGAVLLGGGAHLLNAFGNTVKGSQAVMSGELAFIDLATSNYTELAKKLAAIDAEKTRGPLLSKLEKEKAAIKKSIAEFDIEFDIAADFEVPETMFTEYGVLIDRLEAIKKEIANVMKPVVVAQAKKPSVIDEIAATKRKAKAAKIAIAGEQKLLAKRKEAEQKYNVFLLSEMDTTSAEYQDKFISSEMEKWSKVEGLTQKELDNINFTLLESLDQADSIIKDKGIFSAMADDWIKARDLTDKQADFIKDKVAEFQGVVESGLGGMLTDALKDDLDSFEGYFTSFVDSLQDMWGQMVANMIIQQQAIGSLSMAGSLGVMGVVGIALAGVSKILGDRAERKAEQRRLRELKAKTEEQVTGSIAQLELSDLNYEIFQMNERFSDLMQTARETGMAIDDIIKLRNLETAAIIKQATAGYTALSGSVTDFITGQKRRDWTVDDWQREFGNLSDKLIGLDSTSEEYGDKSLILLTQQFEILQSIHQIQESQLRSLESTSESLTSQIWGLQQTGGVPLSADAFQEQYDSLLTAATTPGAGGMLDTDAISNFQSFIGAYVDTMTTLGADYNQLISGVTGDLESINNDVQSEMQILTAALGMNTDAVDGNTNAIIAQLETLGDTITDIADESTYQTWLQGYTDTGLKNEVDFSAIPIRGEAIRPGQHPATNPQQDALDLFNDIFNPGHGVFSITSGVIDDLRKPVPINPQMEAVQLYMPALIDWLDIAGDELKATDSYRAYYDWAQAALGFTDFDANESLAEHLATRPDLPHFAKGGLSNTPGIFAEAGEPEWAIPAHNNSNNTNFLKTVGMDKVIESLQNSGNGGTTHIHVEIDGREIGNVIVNESRTNPELKRTLRNA